MSCHGIHNLVYRLCEECHISNKSGPVSNDFVRPDINETIPMVYAHTIFSDAVNVPTSQQYIHHLLHRKHSPHVMVSMPEPLKGHAMAIPSRIYLQAEAFMHLSGFPVIQGVHHIILLRR